MGRERGKMWVGGEVGRWEMGGWGVKCGQGEG